MSKIDEKLALLAKHTPYYSQYKKEFASLNDFPIITKKIVSREHSRFVSDISQSNTVFAVSTSGSTGIPLRILWSPMDYCNSLTELWRIRRRFNIFPDDNFVSCHAMFYNGTCVFHSPAIIQKNNLSLSKIVLSKSVFMYYYDLLKMFQPKFMMMPPSFLFGFISFLKDKQLRLPDSIKLIELTGEQCEKAIFFWFQTEYPQIVWKILYGMQEFNGIAYGSIDGLSVLSKNVLVEIVDDNGFPRKTNGEGRVIITGLKNNTFPLIRYDTEDKGLLSTDGLLHITKSRSNDFFNYQGVEYDGSIFWTVIFNLQHTLGLSILQFQVRYEKNRLSFFLVLNDDNVSQSKLNDCISNYLREEFSIKVDVKVIIVDHINIEKSSEKIKFFVNACE